MSQGCPQLGRFHCSRMCVHSYVFDSDGDHQSAAGFEQPNGFFVGNTNQTMAVYINQLIANLEHSTEYR